MDQYNCPIRLGNPNHCYTRLLCLGANILTLGIKILTIRDSPPLSLPTLVSNIPVMKELYMKGIDLLTLFSTEETPPTFTTIIWTNLSSSFFDNIINDVETKTNQIEKEVVHFMYEELFVKADFTTSIAPNLIDYFGILTYGKESFCGTLIGKLDGLYDYVTENVDVIVAFISYCMPEPKRDIMKEKLLNQLEKCEELLHSIKTLQILSIEKEPQSISPHTQEMILSSHPPTIERTNSKKEKSFWDIENVLFPTNGGSKRRKQKKTQKTHLRKHKHKHSFLTRHRRKK